MTRDLVRLLVPPGPKGVDRLLPALAAALDGSGPAIAPLPVGPAVPRAYADLLEQAVRVDGPPLESEAVAAVVATSGSTGAPKGVLLPAAQLTSMTAAVHGAGRPQWVAALPLTSMGGLNVAVRALAAGREPIAVDGLAGAGPFTATDFAHAVTRALRLSDDVRTSLVPTQLARLLTDDVGVGALKACAQVLVGGAALRADLRARARDRGVVVVSTYGATETSGGAVFDGRPLPGVRVEADAGGRLVVFGPCVALGYRADPQATGSAFVDGGFRLPDLGEVTADGMVTVIGRVDDVVVVRGVNVSTSAVEAVVATQPNVDSVAVVSAPGPDGEPRLAAFVVGPAADPDGIGAAVVAALGPAARSRVVRVSTLPLLPGGKVDRIALGRTAAQEGDR